MAKTYDLVIVGSGTAAQVASARIRAAGWKVAVIDHRPFGGTCALRGCDPKRMLISGAEAIDAVKRMRGHGVAGEPRLDWRQLMAFKRSFTDPVPHKQEERYAENGIDTFHGLARFSGTDAVAVEGQELKSRYILIAAGARPVPLDMPGEEHVVTSDRFLELDALPERIALVGGGYIAAEFSHLAARAGARVTVFQRAERMLPAFDPDLVGWLMARFDELGIEVRTRSSVQRIDKTADGFLVHASTDGQTQMVAADLVIHAAGRAPDLDALDLAAAGIAAEKGRLKLNEYLQSVSNPKVYAAGDAANSGPPLTPVSSHDGKIVARNLLDGNRHKPDYRGVPSVAFTIPAIAAVGLSEAEAQSKGLKFRVNSEMVSEWYTARRLNESVYGFKTLVEEDTDHVLGAHVVGPHAEDVINLFGLAIRHGLTSKDLKSTMFAYPTGASDIGYML
ncbi:MAG: NAD(P)/FAD-dependent oxidoreductase [Proteobacteria bacterium]|nr:NAD(P)/FAD-dependent oxidoreductase [Pseudomonadota bacterium]MBI3498594.1 NAD(P)/FAD-dependent oxidoreductase [Pseudomonadota bacterium]